MGRCERLQAERWGMSGLWHPRKQVGNTLDDYDITCQPVVPVHYYLFGNHASMSVVLNCGLGERMKKITANGTESRSADIVAKQIGGKFYD